MFGGFAPGRPGITVARHVPLGFDDAPVLHAQPCGDDGRLVAFHQRAVVRGLPGHRIDVTPLNGAERRRGLPHAVAETLVHRVLGVAIARHERSSGRIPLRHRLQILIEQALQTGAIARGVGGLRAERQQGPHQHCEAGGARRILRSSVSPLVMLALCTQTP